MLAVSSQPPAINQILDQVILRLYVQLHEILLSAFGHWKCRTGYALSHGMLSLSYYALREGVSRAASERAVDRGSNKQ